MVKYLIHACDICDKQISKELTADQSQGRYLTYSNAVADIYKSLDMCEECNYSFRQWKEKRKSNS